MGNSLVSPESSSRISPSALGDGAAEVRSPDAAMVIGPEIGWKQAKRCSSPASCIGGSSVAHRSVADAQRGANRQPMIDFERSGGMPGMLTSRSVEASTEGTEAKSAPV